MTMSVKRNCITCGNELPEDGQCTAHKDAIICDTCGKAMPKDAKRCNACSTYKRFPRMPLVTSVFTILGASTVVVSAAWSAYTYVTDARSHTQFKVATADASDIFVKVWNTGRKPSVLVGYRLRYDKTPNPEVPLVLSTADNAEAKNVIAAGGTVLVALERPSTSDAPALPATSSPQGMTLRIDVQESSDDPGEAHRREDSFSSERIAAFLPPNSK
jgi:hypothetical protein